MAVFNSKKRIPICILILCLIFLAIFSCAYLSHITSRSNSITEEEAISILTQELSKHGIKLYGENYSLFWDKDCIYEKIINDHKCYVLDLQYEETMESVMAYRRFGTYAISTDGKKCYYLNIAESTWVDLN